MSSSSEASDDPTVLRSDTGSGGVDRLTSTTLDGALDAMFSEGGLAEMGQGDAAPEDVGQVDAGSTLDAGCPLPAISVRGGSRYCTISQAIAAAPPNAEIDVPSGTFREALSITEGLTIRGAVGSSAGTLIEAPSGSATALALRGSGIVLENIAIDAKGTVGIEITGSATLTDIRVTGAVGAGLRVLGSGALVTATRLGVSGVALEPTTDSASGVEVRTGASLTIIDSDIGDSIYEGIFVESGTLTVNQSRIYANGRSRCGSGAESCRDGIAAVAGSNVTIMDTEITESGACGVLVLESGITMRHSTSSSNGARSDIDRDGLLMVDTTSATIEGNLFENNWGYGMFCVNASAQCPMPNTRRNNGFSGTNCQGC